jgi:uncharacterized protein YoaH (UPF0181 family)
MRPIIRNATIPNAKSKIIGVCARLVSSGRAKKHVGRKARAKKEGEEIIKEERRITS